MKPHRAVSTTADRLDTEYDLLERMLDTPINEYTELTHVEVMLSQAKRVRREAVGLVRSLAQLRDHLQPEGGTR